MKGLLFFFFLSFPHPSCNGIQESNIKRSRSTGCLLGCRLLAARCWLLGCWVCFSRQSQQREEQGREQRWWRLGSRKKTISVRILWRIPKAIRESGNPRPSLACKLASVYRVVVMIDQGKARGIRGAAFGPHLDSSPTSPQTSWSRGGVRTTSTLPLTPPDGRATSTLTSTH
jgi:hypothetical protein